MGFALAGRWFARSAPCCRASLGRGGYRPVNAPVDERVTLEEAIALAPDANRLATSRERRRFITESVIEAHRR
jgi:hypothetical protein